MDVGQVIFERPWLFDKEVTIHAQSTMCQFEHKGKKIKLLPSNPKLKKFDQKPTAPKKNDAT